MEGLLGAARGAYLSLRPVASVSFAIDWWRSGGTPATFLATNLALHVLTGWALFSLLLSVLRVAALAQPRPALIVAAGAATLWWALQPIHVQAVSYAVQRMTELAALFSVLCVWTYLQARKAERGAILWSGASLLSLALAALSKENAWITPALILMAEFLVLRNAAPLVRSFVDRALLALPVIALGLALTDVVVGGPLSQWALRGYEGRDFTLVERLLTQPKVVAFHVSQILWPMPGRFSLEHDIAIVHSLASAEFWLPLVAILAWSLCGLWLAAHRGTRIVGFFTLWVPVTLSIESSFVPLEMVFEHRMYLPSVGFAGLIALGLVHSARRPRTRAIPAWALLAGAILLSLWATTQRVPQWRTEATLYEQAVRLAPHSARAWNHLGIATLNQRENEHLPQDRYDRALVAFARAIELDPASASPWTNRGVARYLRGDRQSAQNDLEKAIALEPDEAVAHHYLARIYGDQGRHAEARAVRHRACWLGVASDCYR
ncbi:tetratricopeptide repeat protein [Aromatoleum diolicum]|uniref:Tetratricopeptide repeat protein n=2 Tax=Aromatoleum diolicum TaxID=75796 RepID=A0ABX1QFQ0_9RHOO|nr:tetratricopeptide repeat protein [Aromatoleum diolicum]